MGFSLMKPNLQSQSHVTTDDQSASLSWNKTPIWGLRPDFHYCQTIAGLLIQSVSHITTDGQSASLSWYQAPIWGLRPDFYYV
jgi:hypothetical protein